MKELKATKLGRKNRPKIIANKGLKKNQVKGMPKGFQLKGGRK